MEKQCFKVWLGPGKKSNEATCRLWLGHISTNNVEKWQLLPYSPMVKGKNRCQ